jgi:hypothetical protein
VYHHRLDYDDEGGVPVTTAKTTDLPRHSPCTQHSAAEASNASGDVGGGVLRSPSFDADPTSSKTEPSSSHNKSELSLHKSEDEELTKRTILLDLQQLRLNTNIKLTKEWSMDDKLDDMLFELRRHTLALDEQSNVHMMHDYLRLAVLGIERLNCKFGLLDLEGWGDEVLDDLHSHDANLARIYRKYWRRGASTTPELDIALALVGSMGKYHFKRSLAKQMLKNTRTHQSFRQQQPQDRGGGGGGGGRAASGRAADSSSEDEAPPNVQQQQHEQRKTIPGSGLRKVAPTPIARGSTATP